MAIDAGINNRRTIEWDWNKGQELRALRKKAHISSQEGLAARLGVDSKTIGRWERGEVDIRNASYVVVCRLIHILGDECAVLLKSPEEDPFLLCRMRRSRRVSTAISCKEIAGSKEKAPDLHPALFLSGCGVGCLSLCRGPPAIT